MPLPTGFGQAINAGSRLVNKVYPPCVDFVLGGPAMLRSLKRKMAEFIRTQVEVVTSSELQTIRAQLEGLSEGLRMLGEQQSEAVRGLGEQIPLLQAYVEHNSRTIANERRDMEETQRMVGIVCARIENFIKIQKEHRANLEQSVAALIPDGLHHNKTA